MTIHSSEQSMPLAAAEVTGKHGFEGVNGIGSLAGQFGSDKKLMEIKRMAGSHWGKSVQKNAMF